MKFKTYIRQLRRHLTRVKRGLFLVLKNRRSTAACIVAFTSALVVATLPVAGAAATPLAFHEEADFPILTSAERVTFQPGLSNRAIRLAKHGTDPLIRLGRIQAPVSGSKPHFYDVLVPLYQRAEEAYGVDPKLLAAVHFVESGYSGDTAVRSSAGAQGPMQFLAPTFRSYAVDGDGDGVANVTDLEDSVMTAAKYLAANGAASGNIDHALYRYNHSKAYVAKVKKIANDVSM